MAQLNNNTINEKGKQKHVYNATAKGADIVKFSEKETEIIEHWINNYTIKRFNGKTSYMMLNDNKVY